MPATGNVADDTISSIFGMTTWKYANACCTCHRGSSRRQKHKDRHHGEKIVSTEQSKTPNKCVQILVAPNSVSMLTSAPTAMPAAAPGPTPTSTSSATPAATHAATTPSATGTTTPTATPTSNLNEELSSKVALVAELETEVATAVLTAEATAEVHATEIAMFEAAIEDAAIASEAMDEEYTEAANDLQNQIDQLDEARASSAEGASFLEARVADLASQNGELQDSVAEKTNVISELQAAVAESTTSAENFAQSADPTANATIEAHASEVAKFQVVIEDAATASEEMEQKHTANVLTLQNQIDQLSEARASSAEGDGVLEAQCTALIATNAALEDAVAEKAAMIGTLEAAVAETKTIAESAAERTEEAAITTIETHASEVAKFQAIIEDAATASEEMEEEHSAKVLTLQNQIDQLSEARASSAEGASFLEARVRELASQNGELEDSVAEKTNVISELQAAVAETKTMAESAVKHAEEAANATTEAHASEVAKFQAIIEDAATASEEMEEEHTAKVGTMQNQIDQLSEARASSAEGAGVLEAQCTALIATNAALEDTVAEKAAVIGTLETAVLGSKNTAATTAEQHEEAMFAKQVEIDSLTEDHSNAIGEKDALLSSLTLANNEEAARSGVAENEAAKLNAKCGELEASVANYSAEVASLVTAASDAASSAVILSEEHITALSAKQSELDTTSSQLEVTSSKLQVLQTEVDQFEQAGATLRGSVADMQKKDVLHATEVQALREVLDGVESAKDAMSNELDASKRAFETKSTMLDELKTDVTELKTTIKTMRGENETVHTAHEENVAELVAKLQAAAKASETLVASNEVLEKTNSELTLAVDTKEATTVLNNSDREAFKRQDKQIKTLTQELSSEKERSQTIFSQTSAKLESANERVTLLESQNKKLAEEIEDVEAESGAKVTKALQDAQTEIESLEADNKALRDTTGSSATAASRSSSPLSETVGAEGLDLSMGEELKGAQAVVVDLQQQLARANEDVTGLMDKNIDLQEEVERLETSLGSGGRATPKVISNGRITPNSEGELDEQRHLVQQHRETISKLQDACELKTDANEQLTLQLADAKARADSGSSRRDDDGIVEELRTNARELDNEVNRLKMEVITLKSKAKDHESFVRTLQVNGKMPATAVAASARTRTRTSASSSATAKVVDTKKNTAIMPAAAPTAVGGRAGALVTASAGNSEEASTLVRVRPRSPTKEAVDTAVMSPAPKAAKRTTRGLADRRKALSAAVAKTSAASSASSTSAASSAQRVPDASQDENAAPPPVMQTVEDEVLPPASVPAPVKKTTGKKKSALALAKERNAALRQSNRQRGAKSKAPAAKAAKVVRKAAPARAAAAVAATADEEEPAECATQ